MVPVWSRQVGQGVCGRRAFDGKSRKATSSVPLGSTLELESLVRTGLQGRTILRPTLTVGKHSNGDRSVSDTFTAMGKIWVISCCTGS